MKYRSDAATIKGVVKTYSSGEMIDMEKKNINVSYQKTWDGETISFAVGNIGITVPVEEILKITGRS